MSNEWNIRAGDRYVTLDNTGSYTVRRITEINDVEFTDGEFESMFEHVQDFYRLQYSVISGDTYEANGLEGPPRIYKVTEVSSGGSVSFTVDDGEAQSGLHIVDFNSINFRRIDRVPPVLPTTEEETESFSVEMVGTVGDFTFTETRHFLTADGAAELYMKETAQAQAKVKNIDAFKYGQFTVFDEDNNIMRSFVVERDV